MRSVPGWTDQHFIQAGMCGHLCNKTNGLPKVIGLQRAGTFYIGYWNRTPVKNRCCNFGRLEGAATNAITAFFKIDGCGEKDITNEGINTLYEFKGRGLSQEIRLK